MDFYQQITFPITVDVGNSFTSQAQDFFRLGSWFYFYFYLPTRSLILYYSP